MGYIGLPTALMMASHGVEVIGTDYNKELVATLNAGKTTFKEDGLDELFQAALKAGINKHLSEKFYLEGDQRVDLRDKIFREVVANCIVHREYTSGYATELLITASEVRITNPNRPLFHGFINRQNFAPYPKNPNLRKFFTAFGWTEEIGSGVRNTSHYLPIYTGGALPTFEEKEIFVTTLPLKHYVFRPYVGQFAAWLGLQVDCTEHLVAAMGEMEIPVALHDASFEDVLLELVPSWVEKGLKYSELELAKNENIIKVKIKEDPSWVEKGPKSVSKKLWYLIAILSLCTKETSATDIMHYIGYNSLKSFRTRYLMPLRQTGLLTLTKPETPNAPDNKYVITENGKAFLMGR